jgi:CRP-like cAMP-binding protein
VGDADIERLADYLIERRYPQNSMIVEEGLPGDYMYVLQEGRVKVTKLSDDGREKILEILEPRSFFGEMSLLDRSPRSASLTDCAMQVSMPARFPSRV